MYLVGVLEDKDIAIYRVDPDREDVNLRLAGYTVQFKQLISVEEMTHTNTNKMIWSVGYNAGMQDTLVWNGQKVNGPRLYTELFDGLVQSMPKDLETDFRRSLGCVSLIILDEFR